MCLTLNNLYYGSRALITGTNKKSMILNISIIIRF